jgi:uncharacterized protein YcbK (DUF882 family)
MSNWKNFKLDEFKCKHCGENKIEYELIDKLQLLREDLGFPFIISSGYRCEEHPIERKKKKPGTHNLGIAVDIACSHKEALQIVSAAEGYGFTGIGVNQKGNGRFIHLDIAKATHDRPRPHIWSY